MNKCGDLTIGFGHGRPARLPATLAQTRQSWKLVLAVLGIGKNDMQTNDEALEEELFGCSCGEDSHAEDDDEDGTSTDPAMPHLQNVEPGKWADDNERAAERMGLLPRVVWGYCQRAGRGGYGRQPHRF